MKLCSWGSRGVKYNIIGSTIQALKRALQAKKEAFHRQHHLSMERFCDKCGNRRRMGVNAPRRITNCPLRLPRRQFRSGDVRAE